MIENKDERLNTSFTLNDTLIQKGFAVLMLIGIHVFVRTNTELYTYNWVIEGKPWLNYLFYNAKSCVTMFVFLSGFGLNESYNRKKKTISPDIKDFNFEFVKSHLLKLYTNFWVVFLLFAGIGLLFGYKSFYEVWSGRLSFIIDFMGLQDIVTMFRLTQTLNPTWWYMSTIIILYLMFPIIKYVMMKCSFLPVLIGIAINFYAPYATNRQFQTGVFFYIASYALGMYCSEKNIITKMREWWKNKHEEGNLHTIVFYKFLAFAAVVVTFVMRLNNKYWWDLINAISIMIFVDVCIARSNWNVGKKTLSYLGKHSSNIFMLHTFFVSIYWESFSYSFKHPAAVYMVVLLCSLACSIVIEKAKEWTKYNVLQKNICKMKLEDPIYDIDFGNGFDKKESMKVKGISILLLMFHHLFYSIDRVNASGMEFMLFSRESVSILGVMARVCVWLFVFVSAYGLSYQYERKKVSTLQFIFKRWISLMKPYWFVYLVILFLSWIEFGNPLVKYSGNGLHAFLDFMALADFFGTPMQAGAWWYMCLAQVIVVLIPLFNLACKQFGWATVVIGYVVLQYVPVGIESMYGGKYSNYFIVAIIGVLCVQKGFLDKVMMQSKSKTTKYLLLVSAGLLTILKYKLTGIDEWQFGSLINGIVVLLICWFVSCYIETDGIIGKVLEFLGVHSGNMFLFHAFLYTWYPNVVYWSKNTVISYVTLLVLSLAISIVFEYMKKVIRYNYYVDRLLNQK